MRPGQAATRWCSTRCRRSACWPRARCAIAAQVLALKQHFAGRNCTVLLLDDRPATAADGHLQSLAHGVITLDKLVPALRRRSAGACASRSCAASTSAAAITTSSSSVAASWSFRAWSPPSTSTISSAASHRAACPSSTRCWAAASIAGPARCSSVRRERANRRWPPNGLGGRRARRARRSCYAFDESLATLVARSKSLGIDLPAHEKAGRIVIRQIDPAEVPPGQFAHRFAGRRERRRAHGHHRQPQRLPATPCPTSRS